ncbi:MAG: TonB family protein [Longimicrobiales bacterium]
MNDLMAASALSALEQDYEFLEELGRGGSSVVFLARDRVLGRTVAIKLIRDGHLDDEETLARFEREARVLANLEHPCIVSIHAARRLADGSLALIMRHARGQTLRDALRASGPMQIDRVEAILTDVASGLQYLHGEGVVHRDLKPENIFLEAGTGRALISDFGIAKTLDTSSNVTLSGVVIGTPAYMSPEQIDGAELDGRSDLYSLGLVGYELLVGRRPWDGETIYNIIYKQKNEDLPPLAEVRPDTPPHIQVALAGALAKTPEARWSDAGAFLAHLRAGARTRSRGGSASPNRPNIEVLGGDGASASSDDAQTLLYRISTAGERAAPAAPASPASGSGRSAAAEPEGPASTTPASATRGPRRSRRRRSLPDTRETRVRSGAIDAAAAATSIPAAADGAEEAVGPPSVPAIVAPADPATIEGGSDEELLLALAQVTTETDERPLDVRRLAAAAVVVLLVGAATLWATMTGDDLASRMAAAAVPPDRAPAEGIAGLPGMGESETAGYDVLAAGLEFDDAASSNSVTRSAAGDADARALSEASPSNGARPVDTRPAGEAAAEDAAADATPANARPAATNVRAASHISSGQALESPDAFTLTDVDVDAGLAFEDAIALDPAVEAPGSLLEDNAEFERRRPRRLPTTDAVLLNQTELLPALRAAARNHGGIGREVSVRLRLDASGSVVAADVQTSSSSPELDSAALDIARLMRFSPARDDQGPVPTDIVVPIRFLQDDDGEDA